MSDLTRRGFVKTSAGAAVGMTAVGAFDVGSADAERHAAHAHPIVAWVGNPRDGKITVMSGKHEVTIHDRKLAARLARAAK
jgi:hypothetical protein